MAELEVSIDHRQEDIFRNPEISKEGLWRLRDGTDIPWCWGVGFAGTVVALPRGCQQANAARRVAVQQS